MSTSDQLVELMFCWIEQREECAEELKKLAEKLESLREKCNAAECVGSSVAVLGGCTLFGAGIATLVTGGLASPFIVGLGAAWSGAGAAVSVGTKITEHFMSSEPMKKAQKIENKSKEIADKIQRQFEQLKEEARRLNPSADPEEVDQGIMSQFVGAFARRYGLTPSDSSYETDDTHFWIYIDQSNMRFKQSFRPELLLGLTGILTFFTFSFCSRKSKLLSVKGAGLLTKQMSKVGVKTALKGGAMAVGGALTLAFELPEMINSWEDMIKNNHVTEASQSLRNTAEDILRTTRTLREQLDNIKQELQTMAELRSCIENSNRSPDKKKKLIEIAIRKCENEIVKEWLIENPESEAFSELVRLFFFLKKRLNKKKKKINRRENIHIIFVAHGDIEESMIPACCLLPLPTIEDVLLYSPWNCIIDAKVAYGIATGRIEPEDRQFVCAGKGCSIPDDRHQPMNLPDHWNSMKEAGGQMIPNIFISTLRKPRDPAWEEFKILWDEFGRPGRNRIVIPFILPSVDSLRVPFSVVTFALSLGLIFSRFKATVHLAACLGRRSENILLIWGDLVEQYALTDDNTLMTSSEERFYQRYPDLYRLLKDMFG